MIVLLEVCRGIGEPEASRHPEVHQQRTDFLEIKDQILCTAAHASDAVPGDLIEGLGNRKPQPAMADDYFSDGLSYDVRLHAAAGGLDFWELRHAMN